MRVKGRVTVLIPARNERFLQNTIDSLLAGAQGDVEILAFIDGGPWPDPPLKNDKRVVVIRNNESIGMRPCTNAGAKMATGEFLMKCDAHCIFAEGWDEALKNSCDVDWLAVPTRHSIDGATWTMKRRNYNYHYFTFPYAESMYGYGLHGKTFEQHLNRQINEETKDRPIDDLMSFQGSCWFTPTEYFLRLGDLDHANYYFYSESIEVGNRVWMSGGRVVIAKSTSMGHYHKGNNNAHTFDGRVGRGFFLDLKGKRRSEAYATDFWMNDRWPGATRTFKWMIEHFWPLLQRVPATDAERWPDDWDNPKYRIDFLNRPPEAIPAHV